MLTIRAMSDGTGYSSKHLEHRDYYAEGERVIGRWQGRGAELLGLSSEVKSDDFESLRQARHPETGKFLRQRQSADRVASDGSTQSKGRSLYDFTFSAPKSVSIMATLGGDNRLVKAHQKAVDEALHELETAAAARVRQNGAQNDRTTSNLVMAVYDHDTSRELDPQLHTHAVAANLTYDGTEGRWKALQASGIYEKRAYLTEVYRNSLACELRRLGYEIDNRPNGFEIRGISDKLIAKYSQRSRQRDNAIKRFVAENGRQPSDNEIAILVRESRSDKLIEISTAVVHARQRDRLEQNESRLLTDLRAIRHEIPISLDSAERSLIYAQDHIFERVSVCRDHEVLTEALRHGRGHIGHEQLKGSLTLQESTGVILRSGTEIATKASLKREREMIDCVNREIGGFERLGRESQSAVSDRLNPEQKAAIEFVLNSRDGAVNMCGAAGTGKTATLQELHRTLKEADRKVLAVAPTVSAVEELQKVGFADAITIERLLQDPRIQTGIRDNVLIVDEAGMVSGRQMSELLRLSEQKGARIVFSGDTKQIQSVEAGDALRILEKESRLKSVALTRVQRQTLADYREAIQELRQNTEKGFEKLDAIGAIHEVPFLDRPQTIAKAYAEARKQGQNTLVVCATHDEIDLVTASIRSARKAAGEIGKIVQITRDVSQNWTTAQKSEMRNFQPGQLLGFHRAVKGIAKNEAVEVIQVEDKRLIVRDERGRIQTVTPRQAKSFDVLERKPIEVAPADRLLLTANYRTPEFRSTNGEIVTVSHLDSKGRIHLEDGRRLPRNFRQFTHGYAVTAHRSQGKSVDSVIISADRMQKELFYVAASRGRKSVLVVTSDKETFRDSVARSSARQSASEFERTVKPKHRRRIHRGLTAARELAMRAARLMSFRLWRLLPQQDLAKKPEFKSGFERRHDHGISR